MTLSPEELAELRATLFHFIEHACLVFSEHDRLIDPHTKAEAFKSKIKKLLFHIASLEERVKELEYGAPEEIEPILERYARARAAYTDEEGK